MITEIFFFIVEGYVVGSNASSGNLYNQSIKMSTA